MTTGSFVVQRNGFELLGANSTREDAEREMERAASVSERILRSRYSDLEIRGTNEQGTIVVAAVRGSFIVQKEYFAIVDQSALFVAPAGNPK